MRHWSQLATRNWRAKWIRTAGALLAIALGTGVVVWVTCCYESVRQTVGQWATGYIGKSHIGIQPSTGRYDHLPQRLVHNIERLKLDGERVVKTAAPLLIERVPAAMVRADERPTARPGVSFGWQREVDCHGVDLKREFMVRDWDDNIVAGRMLAADDQFACVVEAEMAADYGMGVGDYLLVWETGREEEPPYELEIVGLLYRRRLARFQPTVALVRLAVLQQICRQAALVTSIDVVLEDPRREDVAKTARRIHAAIRGAAPNVHVRSAAARMQQVERAQDQQRVVLILMSCVALLTSLFIILSTLSMGMVERGAQLGLLRCIGMSRLQLAALVLWEIVPLGVFGILVGVPIGLGLTVLTVWLVPDYVGVFTVSRAGVVLAAAAGLATTIVAALLPALTALTVSPLEAAHPRARAPRTGLVLLCLLLAVGTAAAYWHVMDVRVRRDLAFVQWAASSVVLLYVMYALVAPFVVWVISRLAVPVTALLVGVRTRLLQDQVGHAVWRSAGICCGLMVGLSLIVGLVVFNTSFRSGWQFPRQFPEAYVWSEKQLHVDIPKVMAAIPEIKNYTAANSPNVIVEERAGPLEAVLRSFTFFLGIEPDSFLDLVKLEFIEGDEQTARRLLKEGGHLLVASDFARTRKKGVEEVRDADGNIVIGNTVRVWFANRWTTFKVAGVIDSPALDIAASYFQMQNEAMVAAVGSVIGTNDDLKRIFGMDGTKLVLMNFELEPEPVPPGWPPVDASSDRLLLPRHYDTSTPVESRWQEYREQRVLSKLCGRLGVPLMQAGTGRALKDEIDARLSEVTYLLTAIPVVALIVAALGVANLMTANVASRKKQLAILRAVGATRGLVLRMVVGEALVLGVLGSGLGLLLGLHLAWTITALTKVMWGYDIPFDVPWNFVAAAIGLTVGLCILAGIVPARHAARANVIDALHVS